MQLPGVFEVNSTHSDDSKRRCVVTPPHIIVGKTSDHFISCEESIIQFTDENDNCDESSLLLDTAIQESSPKAVVKFFSLKKNNDNCTFNLHSNI